MRRQLVERSPHLRVVGLADWNPSGAAILLCYKHGSPRLDAHQSAVPQLQWLGARSRDVALAGHPAAQVSAGYPPGSYARYPTIAVATPRYPEHACEVTELVRAVSHRSSPSARGTRPCSTACCVARHWCAAAGTNALLHQANFSTIVLPIESCTRPFVKRKRGGFESARGLDRGGLVAILQMDLPLWTQELQVMDQQKIKMEIEGLYSLNQPAALTVGLKNKILAGDYI